MKLPSHPKYPRFAAGFTLLELMVTISIAAVLMGVAIPNFVTFMRSNQITSSVNDIFSAINLARTSAIKTRSPTVMCFSANPSATTPLCNGNGTQGWIVFVDDADPTVTAATDGNIAVDAGETILLRHAALPTSVTVQKIQPTVNDSYILYLSSGFAPQTVSAKVPLSGFLLCTPSAARGIEIKSTGRPRIVRSPTEIAATPFFGCS